MSEEQIMPLFTEICDLQRHNVESSKRAQQKQPEAIDLPKQSVAEFQKVWGARHEDGSRDGDRLLWPSSA